MSDYTIDSDEFAVAVHGILNGVENYIDGRLERIVDETCRYTKDVVESESPVRFGGYSRGWAYNKKRRESGVVGEVGNRKYPGLVHLLEKGHAKTGGGRVRAIPHVKTAADQGEKMLEKLGNAVVEEAIVQ